MTQAHPAQDAHAVRFSHPDTPEPVAAPAATQAAREVRFSGRQAAPARPRR
ncbi:hypothetical protein [Amycolatopsis thermophila]|uniref:Uncharacterized protein n=1 Tax=Amycolatopsis thermophila TaxID=206084 RepID=A0ABU0EPA8_9PSEU|nr:hypothetical protein [Amycolatopsis thermophila]MDQ0376851.1 hypothetical protein [Amycolatopsis thermophila]